MEDIPVMQCYEVKILGCDDSTVFDIEMSEDQVTFLCKIAHLSTETSTYECMPTILVSLKTN